MYALVASMVLLWALSHFGSRMVAHTDSNILVFQFENVKWQYSSDKNKVKKSKDKEEEREETSLGDEHSRSTIQGHSLKDSVSSKQEFSKSRVHLKQTKNLSSGKAAKSVWFWGVCVC